MAHSADGAAYTACGAIQVLNLYLYRFIRPLIFYNYKNSKSVHTLISSNFPIAFELSR